MSRLLIVGVGPYPTEKNVTVTGATIRTRHFVEPLAEAGHEVYLVMLEQGVRPQVAVRKVTRAVALTWKEILEPRLLLRSLDSPAFDAVIGVSSIMPVAAAARVARDLRKPLWVDFNGDPLAEYQGGVSRPAVKYDITLRDHIWKFLREGLNAGDCFSTVTRRGRDAILGQLMLTGRAVEDILAHRKAFAIPNGIPKSWTQDPFDPPFPNILLEEGMSPDTPYIFIGGSWTPWLDEQMMGQVLARVLAAERHCNIVIRGGATDPLAEYVRRSFFQALGDNAPADRVHELTAEQCGEAELLAYASATMLLDRDIPESYLGSRNRLLSFVRWGLNPIVSLHSEVAVELVKAGLAASPETPDAASYTELLRRTLHGRAGQFLDLQQRGMEYLKRHTFDFTLTPVLEWAERPTRWGAAPREGGLMGKWRHDGL